MNHQNAVAMLQNKSSEDANQDALLFSTLWLIRLRMRTGLGTRTQLSRMESARYWGIPIRASTPSLGASYSMSTPSSRVEDDDDVVVVEVEDERDVTSAMVHCSSTSII
jgi:hypothetical protein